MLIHMSGYTGGTIATMSNNVPTLFIIDCIIPTSRLTIIIKRGYKVSSRVVYITDQGVENKLKIMRRQTRGR